MRKINIVCAKSWGKLGNFNSARNVARYLESLLSDCQTNVLPMEDLWPDFANWGQSMQDAATRENPDDVSLEFEKINANIGKHLQNSSEIEKVLSALDQSVFSDSDLCIGMKGVITHLLCQTRARFDRQQHIFNWVTNPGLLDIAIHRCPDADLHLTPLTENIEKVLSWGVAPDKVRAIGPPISLAKDFSDRGDAQPEVKDERCALVFYFHHLDLRCLAVVAQVLEQYPDTLAYVLHASCDQNVKNDMAQYELQWGARLTITKAREQAEFMALLKSLSRFSARALIAKSGPNTMFEAISLGMPMILFRSGLPQEEWVGHYIAQNEVGLCVDQLAQVPEAVGIIRAEAFNQNTVQCQSVIKQKLTPLANERLAVLDRILSDITKAGA